MTRSLSRYVLPVVVMMVSIGALQAPGEAGHGATQQAASWGRTTASYDLRRVYLMSSPRWNVHPSGIAVAGEPLDIVCNLDSPYPHDFAFDLVIDRWGRAGEQHANTVGFIYWQHEEANVFSLNCNSPTFDKFRTTIGPWAEPHTDMKPIPGTDAGNTGLARSGDVLDAVCSMRDNHSVRWDLVINRSGHSGLQETDTVGFVRYLDTYHHYNLTEC